MWTISVTHVSAPQNDPLKINPKFLRKIYKIHIDQKMAVTFDRGIARRWELHRLKAEIVTFQSVKFISSDDTMVKSYDHFWLVCILHNFVKFFGWFLECYSGVH